jgi:hypothetical protein
VRAFSRARAAAASPGRRRTARRLAAIAGVVLVAALASYLVGMNVFLRTRLFRDAISSQPGSLLVDYRGAYSLWPGRIHVEGLTIRGRDSSVEWILRLDRCDFRVSLLALIHKRFHASHVNGDGLGLRVRLRKEGPVSPGEVRALPPVPGFLDPPLADVGPPPPALTDATYDLWSVELDDVDANHVRELWIDTVRYAGDLEVRGRWFFRPLRWLDVGPAALILRSLDVSYGEGEPWLSGATGALTATIHPFALQEVHGTDILDRVSVDGSVRGTLRVANVLGHIVDAPEPDASRVTRADDAPIDAHVRLDHGVLRPETRVDIGRFAAVAAGAVVVDVSVAAHANVDDGGTGHLTVEGSAFRAVRGTSESVRATSVTATAATRDLDLALVANSLDLEGSVEGKGVLAQIKGARVLVPSVEAHTRSLALFGSHRVGRVAFEIPDIEIPLSLVPNALLLLPRGISIESGRAQASVSADVDLESMAATGEARVVAKELRARVGPEAVDGELRLDLRATESHGRTALSGSTLAFDGTVGAPPVAWWARAALRQAHVDARSGLRLDAEVAASAKDASPLAAIIANGTAIPRWILGAISTEGLVATGQLRVSPSTFEARSVTARAAGIDLGFELAELGAEREWALLLDVGVVCAGVDVSGDQTDVLLFGAKPWFEKKTASLRAVERRYE